MLWPGRKPRPERDTMHLTTARIQQEALAAANRAAQKRITYYHERERRAWGRGFTIGVFVTIILVASSLYAQHSAYGATRPAPAEAKRHAARTNLPPHYQTWLRIGVCEQPKRGADLALIKTDADRFRAIAFRQNYNHSFPGGMGMTRLNWETFRLPRDRHIPLMSQASPVSQLWAAERLWRWANRTYPGNGWTAWPACARGMGWTSTNPKDALK